MSADHQAVLGRLKQVPFTPAGELGTRANPDQDLQPLMSRPGPLPDQPPIQCQECENWWQVDPADPDCWTCRECGRLAIYAVQPGRCHRCQKVSRMLREGHRIRSLCLCHLTPDQHRELTRVRDRQLDRERQEKAAQAERQRAWEQSARARTLAAKCWEAKEHRCEVRRNAPIMEECRHCPRWTT